MSIYTKLPGAPDSDQVKDGMAFFEGTGPHGATCGACKHRGYQRQSPRERWSERLQMMVARVYNVQGCSMFKRLTGRHGPIVDKDWKGCKYFEAREKTKAVA